MKRNSLATAILLTLPLSAQALETQPIEEVHVKAFAQKKLNRDTAASVSLVTSDDIAKRQATNLEEAIGTTANLNFAGGTSNARFFQIRGIGERSQFVEPMNPSVGIIVDGMDLSGLGTGVATSDIAQIEVLRGPQGTFYGANALAGLIYIENNPATAQAEASLSHSMSNYNTNNTTAILGGEISEKLSGRIAANKLTSDGFFYNKYLNAHNTNNRDEASVRTNLSYALTHNSELRLNLLKVDIDNGYDVFNFANSDTTLADEPGFDRQDTTGFSTQLIAELSAYDVYANLAHVTTAQDYGFDEDWSYVGFHPWEYASFDAYYRDKTSSTFETRLSSNGASANHWAMGMYLNRKTSDLNREYTYLASPFTSRFAANSYAFFGQYTLALSADDELTVGARFERRHSDYTDSDGINSNPAEDMIGGQVNYLHRLNEQHNFYALLSRGYKAGGFNSNTELPTELVSYDTETLWNAEFGFKGTFFTHSPLNYGLSLFYQQRTDAQIKGSRVIVRDDNSTQFIDYIDNSAKGHNYGLELDTLWTISNYVAIFANVGLLHTELSEDNAVYDGREQAHAPNYMVSTGIELGDTLGWFSRLSVNAKDSFYFSNRHDEKSISSQIINASVGWRSDQWEITGWVKNATDEVTYTRGFGSFGNNPANGYITEPYYQLGAPKQYGVTVKINL